MLLFKATQHINLIDFLTKSVDIKQRIDKKH